MAFRMKVGSCVLGHAVMLNTYRQILIKYQQMRRSLDVHNYRSRENCR